MKSELPTTIPLHQAVSAAVAARVNSMAAEKLYLQKLHSELGRQWRSISDRIELLDRQILAEQASATNSKSISEPVRMLLQALQIAAEEAYQSEVVDTQMEQSIIGELGTHQTKVEWLEERIEEWNHPENK